MGQNCDGHAGCIEFYKDTEKVLEIKEKMRKCGLYSMNLKRGSKVAASTKIREKIVLGWHINRPGKQQPWTASSIGICWL